MTRWPALLLLSIALGCGDKGRDVDQDGFPADEDCDDADALVNPGASELCDGVDQDCNGQIDDGAGRSYYPDLDRDGFGDPEGAPVTSCDPGPDLAETTGDCDDTDPEVNPAAVETCDPVDQPVDQDCDGAPAPPVGEQPVWYRDDDGDGVGGDVNTQTCEPPSPDYILVGGDCDDSDATVLPGAVEVDCNNVDEDCDQLVDALDDSVTPPTRYTDLDQDGYGDPGSPQTPPSCEPTPGLVDNGEDCDDGSPSVFPGAPEVCNGIDDDCDPTSDEDVVSAVDLYADADLDGFGGAPSGQGCPSPGLAEVDGDCDDGVATVNPGAPELCGGVDEDCDGSFDDDAVDAPTWYRDADRDGYGDPSDGAPSCAPLADRVAVADDCDDLDPVIHPGAPERCDAGVDNDCDPATTDEDAPDRPTWYTDLDDDEHGDPLSSTLGCLEPPLSAALGDDCDDADPTRFPGNPELCDGRDNDCDPSTDEELTATWYRDADNDGFGDPALTFTGCNPPADYVTEGGDCDDGDPLLNPLATPGCAVEHCGVVASSQTWKSSVEHRVTCDVVVEGLAKPTLTIRDGAVVRFSAGAGMEVGVGAEGKLIVEGTTLGVTFTSAEPTPTYGDWDGLTLGAQDRGSSLVGLTIEHAGGNGSGGVVVEGGSPILDRLVSRDNLGDGLHVAGSEPLVSGCTLTGNTDDGLYVAAGAGLARTPSGGGVGPSLTGCVVTDNRGRPVTIPGSHADEIATSSVLLGNDVDEVQLLSGVLRFTGTWADHGLPYVVADGADIDVEDGPQAQLYVADAVQVYFGSGASLRIGDGAAGRLEIVQGPLGVLFSGTDDVIAQSDSWDGVLFGPDDDGSVVSNLTVEYAGGNLKGNLWVNGSAPTFSQVISRFSDTSGLYVQGAGAGPEIRDSAFTDNDQHGVYVESGSKLARSVVGPTFTGNVLTGNGDSPITLPADFVGQLDPSNTFAGNGRRIGVLGGTVTEDALWRGLDEDYQVAGDVIIGGPQDPVVEIEDGVTVLFDANTSIEAGSIDDGALLVDAIVGVTFTSSDPSPGEGDWDGVVLGRNGLARPQSRLAGLTVEYAGGSNVGRGGAIEVMDRDLCASVEPYVELLDLDVIASSKSAVWAEAATTLSVDGLFVAGALGGCWDLQPTANCPSQQVISFTGNDCSDGAVFGVFPLSEVDQLDASSTYPGPVVVESTQLTQSVTMPLLPVPYTVTSLVAVADGNAPVLTVPSGVTVGFGDEAGLSVGVAAVGGLVLEPGALLTSARATVAPGDWEGVRLGNLCVGVDLQGAIVEYAGDNGQGALWIEPGCDAGVIDANTITDSSTCGVMQSLTSLLPVTGTTFSGNLLGDLCVY